MMDVIMKTFTAFLALTACCLAGRSPASAFQPSSLPPVLTSRTPATSLRLAPEIQSLHSSASIVLSSEGESWRQYVPLAVSVGVIFDILLGSPVANLALGPMRRASEKGATGDTMPKNEGDGGGDTPGGSLFSAFSSGAGSSGVDGGRGKERVDSNAIAQATLDKAMNTLELRRFLEENKTEEQRYEDMRKKLDEQMRELDEEQ